MKIGLDMPEDVRKYVLDIQGKKKAATGRGQISQQEVIYDIIREHKKFLDDQMAHSPSAEPEHKG